MRHPLPLDGNYLGPAAGEEMQIGGPGDTNYKLRDGGGREGQWAANISSGTCCLRAKLQVVSDFRHTRGEILSLLVKDEKNQ